ncbi:hypothetical protein [Actinocatenispora comari]|jgi:hypothetical protein|uniref:Uncharacterized protein n=1 Tax=Actinocatenispora comari TaxID=2807577 RepID=A0A8J4AIZ1_9ACTN|nr:hypothetical protein [Actinocatenispora comari]GIL29568.1 hypothetical protein NUM_48220 [Actinocatenispora comari]
MTPSRTATPTPTRPVKPPLRRTPLTLLLFLLAGFACAVAVLAATIIIYIGQDAYKAGHQTSPTEAVDEFLDATLNKRSMDFASTYLCSNPPVKQKTRQLIGDIHAFEKSNPGTFLTYEWSIRKVWQRRDRALVTAQVRARTTASGSSTNNPEQKWKFSMRNESGWKVCGLTIPEN